MFAKQIPLLSSQQNGYLVHQQLRASERVRPLALVPKKITEYVIPVYTTQLLATQWHAK